MTEQTKENVYDKQINPLMAQIIEICREHKIAHVASFALGGDDDLLCTSCATTDEYDPPEQLRRCVSIITGQGGRPLLMTVKDGGGNVTEMHSIV